MRRSTQKACADGSPDAARKLWAVLQDRAIAGLRFRNSERVGPYVVDFLCPAARVILLVEGDTPIDAEQTQWFREHGYRVVLLPQADILSDPSRVLDAVAQAFEIRVVSPKN